MNPLTGLYGAATSLRNTLFDRGWLRSRRLKQPVVSVGNLSAGGAGKTPFVIALGGLLKARGMQFDILSRGYGRKTRGVLVVDPNGSAAEFGDEPLLIARRLGVPVIVGESRYEAGVVAERKFATQVHLLDDGFQHRALARDFDIVLVTESDFEDRLLPSGRLREPLSSLQRADAIVVPHFDIENGGAGGKSVTPTGLEALRARFPALKAGIERHSGAWPPGGANHSGNIIWLTKREISVPETVARPIAFCGIARPQQFFAQIRGAGIAPAAEVEFRDHHAYDAKDIERLVAMRDRVHADGFLTTEKDVVNLGSWREKLEPLAIVALKLTICDSDDVVETIRARLDNRRGRS